MNKTLGATETGKPESLLIRSLSLPRFLVSGLVNVVFPPGCRFCGGPLEKNETPKVSAPHHFCWTCLQQLALSEPMMREACRGCGMPSPGLAEKKPISCPLCRDRNFHFDAVLSLWMYRDRVCDAIVASKYAHNSPLADALGHRLGWVALPALIGDLPTEVTYVPSHVFRQLSRGGLGNRTIAQAVARQLGVPLRHRLRTCRQIAKQAWLDDEGRKQNVHGAFITRKSYAFPRSPPLADRHILVVDDVLTTGATANEIARVLKQAGVARVTVAVVSRAARGR